MGARGVSVFTVIPKQARLLAVRSWPGNEDDIENIFGDRVRKSPAHYDYDILGPSGSREAPVFRGDWIVLDADNNIKRYTHVQFEKEFTIMENVFHVQYPQDHTLPEEQPE